MLEEIGVNTNLYYWGKVCLNNEITRATACTNLKNDGIVTFSDPSSNRVSFINFSCEMDESKLTDCGFDLDNSPDCNLNEQLPFDCNALVPPSIEPNGVIGIANTTPMLRSTESTTIPPNTTTSHNITTISSHLIPTLQTLPISVGLLAAIAAVVGCCIVLTLIIAVMLIVGIILAKRLRDSKVRERETLPKVANN